MDEATWQGIIQAERDGMTAGFGRLPGGDNGECRVFIYPDMHFPYQDEEVVAFFDDRCDSFKPTHIIYIGDLLDCYSASSFDKDPDRKETLNDERNAARKWLRGRKEANPDAEQDYIEGNHEERIMRQIKRYLPGLYDMPELSLSSLLSLDKLGIRHHKSTGFRRWGLNFIHGTSTAKYSANAEMTAYRSSGISGHVHRKMHARFKDKNGYETHWWSVGHATNMDFVSFVNNPDWTHSTIAITIQPDGEMEYHFIDV